MAAHYFSINRGKSGTKFADITQGASSASSDDIELRVEDAKNLTRKDVIMALRAFIRVMENPRQSDFPPQ